MDLKDGAIYKLPNGRELVARMTWGSKSVLCSLNAADPDQYELNHQDRLLRNGLLTAWEKKDLFATGRTASPEVINVFFTNLRAEEDNIQERNL